MPEDRQTNQTSEKEGKAYTDEELKKKVDELAEAKVKAIREKEEFERQKADLEKQRQELDRWKDELAKQTIGKQEPSPQPKQKVKEEPASNFEGLSKEQQVKLYEDFERRQFDLKMANFRAEIKGHIQDNKDDLGHVSKMKDDQVFNMIVAKMNDHKNSTGQDLSIVDAVKNVDSDVKSLIGTLAPQQKTSELDIDHEMGDDSYKEDFSETSNSPVMSQELEDKGSDTGKETMTENDLSKIPEGSDLMKSVFQKTSSSV